MLMLAKKITYYRLHMARIAQNKQKYLISLMVPQGRKFLIRLDQKDEYSTSKTKKSKKRQ